MSEPTSIRVALLTAIALAPALARAQTTHTVCPSGCDFPSPAACAVGDHDGDGVGDAARIANGDTCLVMGGEYHETVTFQSAPLPNVLRDDLVFRCAPGASCTIDGDGVRDHAFHAFRGWVIEGFEITSTRAEAITAYYDVAAVRDCRIHDVRGHAIEELADLAVVERNVIVDVVGDGIACEAFSDDQTIRNNLVLRAGLAGGAGIRCAGLGALVEHNTVDVRDRTAPFADPVSIGIHGGVVDANIVLGGTDGVNARTSAASNIVFGVSGTPFLGAAAAGVGGNVVADPLLHARDDHHLTGSSPAIDAATGSTVSEDLEGNPRVGVPDVGALEHDPSHVADPGPWPFRETVVALGAPGSSASILLPGDVPALAWYDDAAGTIAYAVRLASGSWHVETVEATNVTGFSTANDPSWRFVDLALDESTGAPVLAWVEDAGGRRRVRVARREGDACGTDCVSSAWSGCDAAPALDVPSADTLSIRLAVRPSGDAVVGALHVAATGCSGSRRDELVAAASAGGVWSTDVVTGGCTHALGRGFDLALNPASGAIEVVVVRSTDFDPFTAAGELLHGTDASGAFVPAVVPLGAGVETVRGVRTVAALAPTAAGDLGAAVQVAFGDGREGIGFVERVAGSWGAAEFVDRSGLTSSALADASGASVRWVGGTPWIAYGDGGVLALAHRSGGDWDHDFVDARAEIGAWPRLHVTSTGGLLITSESMAPSSPVRVLASAPPPGVSAASLAPPACDDGNACTVEMCGASGCTSAPVSCDDGDPCTADSCDPATGCAHAPAVGASCDDGDACTTADACDASGACVGGAAASCDDGNGCTVDACDPSAGCTHAPDLGASCDDGDACTSGDVCDASGACAGGGAIACDDGDPCTADACDPASGCTATPSPGASCDDGDACTSGDVCDASGTCAGGAVGCDDANPCTADACDPSTGCVHTPVADGTSCADGDVCNGAETCTAGACAAGTPLDCDDGNVCTADACDPSTGCSNTPVADGTSCADGDVCNGAETCADGACATGTPLDCDDGNVCTADGCDPSTGCSNSPVSAGVSCDDGDACTVGEACDGAGACGGGTIAPSCADAGTPDGGIDGGVDSGVDGGPLDGGVDGGPLDAGATVDGGAADAGADAGPPDAGPDDAGTALDAAAPRVDGGADAGPDAAASDDAAVALDAMAPLADAGPDAGDVLMDGGCGCRIGAHDGRSAAWLVAASLLLLALRRRR